MLRQLPIALVMLALTSTAHAQSTRLDQDAADAFASLNDTVTLRFLDAVKGTPISGAKVTFEGATKHTDSEGAVNFSEPEGLSEDETRVARFEHPKYVHVNAKVRFLIGKVFFNRYSISPALPPGRIRVVLDWRETPRDLDAHLKRQGVYHLSYRDMRNYKEQAWLDRDDQDGLGPETITVLKLAREGRYSYVVHDYTHRDKPTSRGLSQSRAHVRVYTTDGILQSFVVPSQGQGNHWHVFDIIDGQVRPVNTLTAPR